MKSVLLAGLVLLLAACRPVPTHPIESVAADTVAASPDTVAAPAPRPVDTVRSDRFWNDLARYLAGLPPEAGSTLDSADYAPETAGHRQVFDQLWARKRRDLLDSLGAWATAEFPETHRSTRPVFYPFSGADFVTIHTLYPNAESYTLFGLEPEGRIPHPRTLTPDRRQANLLNLQYAMDDIMAFSFFKTNDMRGDFTRFEWKGTLPLLLAFCARCGNEVVNAYRIRILPDGSTAPATDSLAQDPNDATVTGWRIRFRAADGSDAPIQTLDYFSVNVHNPFFGQLQGFPAYFEAKAPMHTYIKSASYLLHKDYFSQVGRLIQQVSPFLLQDDSGFPLRAFDPQTWELTFYGAYERPIPLFANLYQLDLHRVYLAGTGVRRLPFGIGYVFIKGRSNLMLARKRETATE